MTPFEIYRNQTRSITKFTCKTSNGRTSHSKKSLRVSLLLYTSPYSIKQSSLGLQISPEQMSLALRSWHHLKIRRNQLASQKHPTVTLLSVINHLADRHLVDRHTKTCRTIEQHILTNVNNCLNTNIYS